MLIDEIMQRLHSAQGDLADIEVKSAAGGVPESLGSTLCALANLPGGGWIVLGLDESAGFAAVPLANPQSLRQSLASRARACTPPVVTDFAEGQTVNGSPVIVVRIVECTASAKPCRDSAGVAWIRSGDGDYRMAAIEEQGFLSQRLQPHFDRLPVTDATRDDLDPTLLTDWAEAVSDLDPRGLGRFEDHDLLVRGGLIDAEGRPSKAAVLALGIHPQQHFPRLAINLVSTVGASDLSEVTTVTGPIPAMLEGSLRWARRVFARTVRKDGDGNLRDAYEYPLEAFRELVGNALIHRDLDEWSAGRAIEVRHLPDRLVVTNPGGLYGITVDRLGLPGTTSARNGRLLEVCKYVRTSEGGRVLESAATGIPRILDALNAGGHPAPNFSDTGIQFTAVLRPRPERLIQRAPEPGPALSDRETEILALVGANGVTVADLEASTGLKAPNLRKILRSLVGSGLVEQHGGRGRPTTYRPAG